MTTITPPSLSIIRCGTEQTDKPGRTLSAGPMTVEFDNGQLRYLRVNGIEVLRAIGFLVRDENWGTYVPVITKLRIDQRNDGFSISFHAACHRDDQQLDYDASIQGTADGKLSFMGSALPGTDFLTARTGFVVLHPLKGVASQPVRVEHVDGKIINDRFPEAVDPIQPFLNIRALTHEVSPGLMATVRMEGDAFEMEDHRNWTDASFKTYVRPLSRPWPYTLKAGKTVEQSITVSLEGKSLKPADSTGDDLVNITVGKPLKLEMPSLGLGMPAEEIAACRDHVALLKLLAPRYLVCHFDPRQKHGIKQLKGYRKLGKRTGADIVLEVVVENVSGFKKELKDLAKLVEEARLKLAAIEIVPAGDLKSVLPGGERPPAPDLDKLYRAARASFPGVSLGGGMFSFFTELNRKRVPTKQLDFLHNTTCPIVHAADDRSVMETLEALPYQVDTARSFAGPLEHRVGPSGLGCRDNPHGATWTPNPNNERVCLTKLDPRQRGLFGAAWTLGYIATLAKNGVKSISMGAPTGPLGYIYRPTGHKQPWFDNMTNAAVFPAFHVIAGLTRCTGNSLLACQTSNEASVQSLAIQAQDGSTKLWLANLSARPQKVLIQTPEQIKGNTVPAKLQGLILDNLRFVSACTEPESFQSSTKPMRRRFVLKPYAVAILTIDAKPAS